MASTGGIAQSHHFCMGATGRLGLSLANHVTLGRHKYAAHRRVGRGLVLRLEGKLKGEFHHVGEFTVLRSNEISSYK